jgi:hypothetical protein
MDRPPQQNRGRSVENQAFPKRQPPPCSAPTAPGSGASSGPARRYPPVGGSRSGERRSMGRMRLRCRGDSRAARTRQSAARWTRCPSSNLRGELSRIYPTAKGAILEEEHNFYRLATAGCDELILLCAGSIHGGCIATAFLRPSWAILAGIQFAGIEHHRQVKLARRAVHCFYPSA